MSANLMSRARSGGKFLKLYGDRKMMNLLPYDAEVEYLESTGKQWIDTGKVLSSTGFAYDADVMFQTTYNCIVFGGRTVADNVEADSLSLFIVNSMWRFDNFGSSRTGPAVNTGIRYSVSLVDGKTTVNGVELDTPIPIGRSSGATVYIFAGHRPQESVDVEYQSSIRLYSLKFRQDGVLTADYRPVRVGAVGYIYDRVSDQLYGNAGTGAFIIGPDKTI